MTEQKIVLLVTTDIHYGVGDNFSKIMALKHRDLSTYVGFAPADTKHAHDRSMDKTGMPRKRKKGSSH